MYRTPSIGWVTKNKGIYRIPTTYTGSIIMAKATSREEYAKWKNEVSMILYGPVGDVFHHPELAQRMRDSIAKLCGEIDEATEILDKDGVFDRT
jgi:hypothetical protein